METKKISIQPFQKALKSLSAILKEKKTEIVRDATIQRFEYTFELAWKLLKRFLESQTVVMEPSVKNIFREAGKLGLIDSVEDWFEYLQSRNLTSHTYEEATADQVYEVVIRFEKSARFLEAKLEKILE